MRICNLQIVSSYQEKYRIKNINCVKIYTRADSTFFWIFTQGSCHGTKSKVAKSAIMIAIVPAIAISPLSVNRSIMTV